MHTSSIALSMLLTFARLVTSSTQTSHTESVTFNVANRPTGPQIIGFRPPHNQRQNVNNKCGNLNGKLVKCDPKSHGGGPCCSQWGWCGTGPVYCGTGCQSQFGECEVQLTAARVRKCGPKHKNQKCTQGECCSANGKCGRSEAFCGKHCKPEFGACHHKNDQKPKPAPNQKPMPVDRIVRCGKNFENKRCADGDCCSHEGWCGKGNVFCSVPQNCQRAFGTCDSDAVPQGPDLAPTVQPRPQIGKVPYLQIINKCTKAKTAALTFDDGPSNNTHKVLDVLRDHKAKATFFLSGNTNARGMIDEENVWISVIKRIIQEGHQIGSHGWSHAHLNALNRDARLFDMIRNDRAITNIIGKFPTYMRPPYLECSKDSGCLKDMADLGYHAIGFEVDTHDWEDSTTLEQMKTNVDNAMKGKKAEDNILFIQHDHNRHAIELTKYILEQIQKKQWTAVTIGECLDDPSNNWYIEPSSVEPRSIAGNNGIDRGCIVSAPGFCGTLRPFHNAKSCRKSTKNCEHQVKSCRKHLKHEVAVCKNFGAICRKQHAFCKKCGKKNHLPCNSDSWIFTYPK